MNLLPLLLILLKEILVINSQLPSDNEFLRKFLGKDIDLFREPRIYESCDNRTIEIKCNDCRSLLVCDGTPNLGSVVPCPDQNPFCDVTKRHCVTEAPSTGCPLQNQFCSGPGYYPFADSCSKYFVCEGVGSTTPHPYQCPPKMVYDPVAFRCRPQRSSKDCATMKCVSPLQFVVHPLYPQFFGFCNDQLQVTVVLKCENNFVFNVQNQVCEFKCPKIGYFLGSDATKFIICYKAGATMRFIEETCPSGYYYDEVIGYCRRIPDK